MAKPEKRGQRSRLSTVPSNKKSQFLCRKFCSEVGSRFSGTNWKTISLNIYLRWCWNSVVLPLFPRLVWVSSHEREGSTLVVDSLQVSSDKLHGRCSPAMMINRPLWPGDDVHWIIRFSSVSGASSQNGWVLLIVCSSRWNLAFVGRRRWLKKNIVCSMVGEKASVLFQMSPSRCG